jgi:hypothetical protein
LETRFQEVEADIARVTEENEKHGRDLSEKRERTFAQAPVGHDVDGLLQRAEVLKVELGLTPIELELPLSELRARRAELLEEVRQEEATAAAEAALVARAEADLQSHEAVTAACLGEMQVRNQSLANDRVHIQNHISSTVREKSTTGAVIITC